MFKTKSNLFGTDEGLVPTVEGVESETKAML